jgi:hypothetical protein
MAVAMLRRLTSIGSDRLSGTLLFLLALFILWQNRAYPIGTLTEPGAGFLPLFLGIAFAITSALVAWHGTDSLPLKNIGWGEAPRAIAILVACGFAASIVEWLGYRLTIFAVLVFLLGVIERKPIHIVLPVAVGFSLLSYFVFFNLLDVQLPRSPWEF